MGAVIYAVMLFKKHFVKFALEALKYARMENLRLNVWNAETVLTYAFMEDKNLVAKNATGVTYVSTKN